METIKEKNKTKASIKTPKLKFKRVYYVKNWNPEIKEGFGAEIEYEKYGYMEKGILFYGDDGSKELLNPLSVFDDITKAQYRLESETRSHIKYLIEERERGRKGLIKLGLNPELKEI